jgi:hypothetical protein
LFFVFRDGTRDTETYGAARFLTTDGPQNGQVLLDFNKAVNPPCAYNPFTTCPLPSKDNRLTMRMRPESWITTKAAPIVHRSLSLAQPQSRVLARSAPSFKVHSFAHITLSATISYPATVLNPQGPRSWEAPDMSGQNPLLTAVHNRFLSAKKRCLAVIPVSAGISAVHSYTPRAHPRRSRAPDLQQP